MSTARRTGHRRSSHRRGYDVTFAALIDPRDAAEEANPGLRELRASCDTSAVHAGTRAVEQARDHLRALRFLRDLDALDQRHAAGDLDDAAHTRLLDDRHCAVSIEVWMTAAQLSRLTQRITAYRHARQGTQR